MRQDARIHGLDRLVSLPGYRSQVDLDSGVMLTLWGNVPEISGAPPVLENAVLMLPPEPGFDLALSLDCGRVHFANRKPASPAKVRARLVQGKVWDVTLPTAGSEAVLELWTPPPQLPAGQPTPAVVTLYARGPVHLEANGKNFDLPDRGRVTSTSDSPTPKSPEAQPMPAWWTDRLDPNANSALADAMLALKDWHGWLTQPGQDRSQAVLDTIQTHLRESPNPAVRKLALLFLTALDAATLAADFLEDPEPEVRGTAAFALRGWLARDPAHAAELAHYFQKQRHYLPDKANTIVGLLHAFPPEALGLPDTYQVLISLLRHENRSVRELALWHLRLLVPEGRSIAYDPTVPPEQSRAGADAWQKQVSAGTVPKR